MYYYNQPNTPLNTCMILSTFPRLYHNSWDYAVLIGYFVLISLTQGKWLLVLTPEMCEPMASLLEDLEPE